MPLTMFRPGQSGNIQRINGKDSIKTFLNDLGLTIGEEVTVVSEWSGNLILQVKESRVALDKDVARRIMVA